MKSETVEIPEGVKVEAYRRRVVVEGPRGRLEKVFGHLNVEILVMEGLVKVQVWHGSRMENACVQSLCSHIKNMIIGVTKGFKYKMKSVYAHFPININITENNTLVEIRNFLGEKMVRRIQMLEGVTAEATGIKDEIAILGNCLESVSQSAALVQQSAIAKNKDIRKFLDGIYVSEHGHVLQEA